MSTTASEVEQKTKPARPRTCRFFDTKGGKQACKMRSMMSTDHLGCRAGTACPYLHITTQQDDRTNSTKPQAKPIQPRRYQAPVVDSSKVVQKPQVQTEDARTFQIGQIKRRFSPEHTGNGDPDVFNFKMTPSDPDFPYDLEALECSMAIPKAYPEERAKLKVLNKEIPRGFQINIERGFSTICAENPGATLLGMMNRLDRQLEAILSGEMAETIKIVAHRGPRPAPQTPVEAPRVVAAPTPVHTPIRSPAHSSEDKTKAQARRQADTRQLEARFGRLPVFTKSTDGLRYTLPLDSSKKSTWPAPVQNIRVFTLIIPELYPLESAALSFDSDSPEARNIETAFQRRAVEDPSSTLTQLINYLTINLKEMAQTEQVTAQRLLNLTKAAPKQEQNDTTNGTAKHQLHSSVPQDDKSHIHVIPRPPEWEVIHGADSESSDSDSYDSADDTAGSAAEEQVYSSAPIERGILLSFPNLELHGIELMEMSSLSITIKCDRCRDTMDVERLRSSADATRSESCKKCANGLGIGFRADLIHITSVRAGYLDLDGCTVLDMLPSSFQPTCAECSTPAPAVVSVRGESTMAICRECHKKMSFRISEVKFLHISAANIRASRAPARKPKEKLGIVAGTELPRKGRCTHYAKSYRWFRFSCCNKVYACDRCHDEAEEHPNEHANRMLCGYCSREQNYRPEDCGICHAVLVGKRGHGFWEGGQGTRDKARMSRKDPRKYKRIGGSAVGKKS